MAVRAAIGLGSNLGDKAGNIERAIDRMGHLGELISVSTIYQTAPIGGPDQPPYYNAVALLDTDLEPRALLDGLLEIEQMQGRQRKERWGPRIIDLDVLLYGDEVIDEPGLVVPHPRMTERRFVLDPLLEVWPDAACPMGLGSAPSSLRWPINRCNRLPRSGCRPEPPVWCCSSPSACSPWGSGGWWTGCFRRSWWVRGRAPASTLVAWYRYPTGLKPRSDDMDITLVGPGRAGMAVALAAREAGHAISGVLGTRRRPPSRLRPPSGPLRCSPASPSAAAISW